ncbi:aromatic ring-hydroxylating dioxygenase subunit alpha [Aquabacterium sp. J223]|uniref:aromatic ring-hydroxylating dioxygenase subunit alpha n=1 Tax=Aquabacterium sp. J223 TaxID=2898431 RepID=UPI0021AE31DC|nr:aromatic ring-hydroxylating dioxygenase subunit alpha [Aquabacterium sp. J223]UUX94492.1 aromatic ring-hydroxylating dioxygenase subunit alpha [Aquabacterium sp. J223]
MNDVATPAAPGRTWPDEGLTRIPYWVYTDEALRRQEQQRLYQGETWNYLCLEADLAQTGDYVSTFVGETPVVAVRAEDGELYAFENRCAHRGALIALENAGRTDQFTCVYHAWSYDLQGTLKGVAFEQGVAGKGGMPPGFDKPAHSPRKLRVATTCGLVFGSFSDDVPDLEDYIGEAVLGRIRRILGKGEIEVLGRFTQKLPNNWKLYFENVKDSYHASLLHLFLTTFDVNRLTQKGGLIVSEDGGNHVSYSMVIPDERHGSEYRDQGIRSENQDYTLHDTSFLQGTDEIGDGITLQILSVFPGFVLGQVWNSFVVRQVLPKGVDETELHWTYFGFREDTPEQRTARLKQLNLVGPAGLVSMEDGCVGGFVQRGIATAEDERAVVQMGGDATSSSDTRATEASVRGFWKAYRRHMGL